VNNAVVTQGFGFILQEPTILCMFTTELCPVTEIYCPENLKVTSTNKMC
jgi:hypothetical protein